MRDLIKKLLREGVADDGKKDFIRKKFEGKDVTMNDAQGRPFTVHIFKVEFNQIEGMDYIVFFVSKEDNLDFNISNRLSRHTQKYFNMGAYTARYRGPLQEQRDDTKIAAAVKYATTLVGRPIHHQTEEGFKADFTIVEVSRHLYDEGKFTLQFIIDIHRVADVWVQDEFEYEISDWDSSPVHRGIGSYFLRFHRYFGLNHFIIRTRSGVFGTYFSNNRFNPLPNRWGR